MAVDYNDHVKTGQVLSQLDTAKPMAQVLETKAALVAAHALVARSQADVKQSLAKLLLFREARKTSGGKVPSRLEMIIAEAALAQAEADEESARADVSRAEAELNFNQTNLSQVLTSLLGAIAAVSLLVGGIGIMNIMLVAVTERTREIGTRLAIGALAREVLLQFLVEAVVLSSLGGIIGIVFAIAVSAGLAKLLLVPLVIDPGIILLAFIFSAAIGIFFGYFPARNAARLDPIEALRHE